MGELRLLGHTEVVADGLTRIPPSGRICTVLAVLAVHAGSVVSADHLIDQLWLDELPKSGPATLHVYVSRLRKLLTGTGVELTTRAPGYRLDLADAALDLQRLAEEIERAEAAAEAEHWSEALDHARSAAQVWRGRPFADAAGCPDLEAEEVRLTGLRDRADELAARALLALARPAEAEAVAERLTGRDELNEAYWRLRVEAAYADGRAADALTAYQAYADAIADELGLDPSPAMAQLHLDLLRGAAPIATKPSRPATAVEPPPVTARYAERRLIDQAIDAATAGSGRLISLEGEPGIGKTLLAEYAAARAQAAGLNVTWARAVDGPGTPALWVWEQLLAALPGSNTDAAVSGAEQLRALTEAADRSGVDPERARFRLAEQLTRRVVEASNRIPLLVVVDDLQWADNRTVDALRLLGPLVRGRRFSIVLTSRPTAVGSELAAALAALAREESADRVVLPPFSTDDVAAYLAEHHGSADAETLHERSAGNPLFLVELVRGGSAGPGVPATVSGLVRQRVAALPPATADLLAGAAVAGRRLEPEILARAVGVSVLELLTQLEPVLADGLLVEDRTARSWSFSHDLVRDAIAEQLGPSERARWHARLADAIEQIDADEPDDRADELAHHRFEAAAGSASAEAYEACMRAADVAAGRLAYDQAAQQRGRALASLPPGEPTRIQRFEVLMQLTAERRLAGDVVGASASLRSALELARRLGDRGRVIRAVSVLGGITLWNWRQFGEVDTAMISLLREMLDESDPALTLTPRQRAELAGTLAVELYYDPDGAAEGEARSAEAVTLARTLDDPVLLGRALNNQVIAIWRPGQDVVRRAALDEALSWAGRGLPRTAEVIARLHRGPLALRAGDVVGFEADLDRATELTPKIGVFEIEGQLTAQQAGRAILRGEHELAVDLVQRAYAQLGRTNLWALEYTDLAQRLTLARIGGRIEDIADRLVARSFEDAHRSLRWSALLTLAQTGDLRQARALQVRWGLQRIEPRTHWASTFEWAQAAELALLLGAPAPSEAYAALARIDAEVVVIGTALAVWGPVAALQARLAAALGDTEAERRHTADARRVTERVTTDLGHPPSWCYQLPL